MNRYIVLDIEHGYEHGDADIEFIGDFYDWLDAVRCLGSDYHCILDTETGELYTDTSDEVRRTYTDFRWYMIGEVTRPLQDR